MFRVAYDELRRDCPATADRQYLKILEVAAQEGEQRVREALQVLIERGQRIRFEALRECLVDPVVEPWEVMVEKMDVASTTPSREPGGEVMSTGNLPRLRECLIELHLPAFREHYAAQAALATQESLS